VGWPHHVGFSANRLVSVYELGERGSLFGRKKHSTRMITIQHIETHSHLKFFFAGGASLRFGIARGELAANLLFREAFAPILLGDRPRGI